jgi:hypothetical protein
LAPVFISFHFFYCFIILNVNQTCYLFTKYIFERSKLDIRRFEKKYHRERFTNTEHYNPFGSSTLSIQRRFGKLSRQFNTLSLYWIMSKLSINFVFLCLSPLHFSFMSFKDEYIIFTEAKCHTYSLPLS